MATAVLLPSPRPHPYPQGILQPRHRPLITMQPSPSPTRRIRFAPLPDPRRSVLITDDGNELPLPQAHSATHFPAPPTPSPLPDSRADYFSIVDSASLSSSSSDSKRHSDLLDPSFVSTPGTATPVSFTTTTPSEYDVSVPPSPVSIQYPSPLTAVSNKLSEHSASKSRPFSSIFRFKRNSNSSSTSSSTTITPVASIDRSATPTSFSRKNFSAEEILTLGTINLFRASSSKDTSDCETGTSSSGWSLTRWTSASSSNSHRHHKEPAWGHPLTRASSTQSYQSKSKALKDAKSNRSRVPNRKGTRLLNGRYYGVKPRPQNANPFANARDNEPEFVEWGYGGMGSVKGATSAGAHGHWERLHGATVSSQKTIDEDEDDGSGMAWIKKRREQREKEKNEKEEKERLEREALENAESVDTVPETPLPSATLTTTTYLSPQSALEVPGLRDRIPSRPGTASSAKTVLSAASSVTVTPNQVPTPKPSMPTLTIPLPSPPTLIVTPSASSATASCTPSMTTPGVTRAISIPAPAHHYHHRHSRTGSKDLTVIDPSTPSASVTPPDQITHNASEDESESDNEVETESDEEYEEDEESDEEQRTRERKTALGAGVEKISRHH